MARGAIGGWPRLVAMAAVTFWVIVGAGLFWASDATGYLAAGERLNAGHDLYGLGPGDRPVEVHPPLWSSPFLYPPIWGLLWRPLAALPMGLWVWMAAIAAAMLWWAWTARPWVVLAVSIPFGMLLASGNVGGLILVGMALVPSLTERRAGIAVGTMAAIKVFPGILIVWFLATGRHRAAAWTVAVAASLTLVGYLSDPELTRRYVLEVVPSTQLLGSAPATVVGLPTWSSWAVLALALAWTIWRRSYGAAVVAAVIGAPASGFAAMAQLGAGVADGSAPTAPPLSGTWARTRTRGAP